MRKVAPRASSADSEDHGSRLGQRHRAKLRVADVDRQAGRNELRLARRQFDRAVAERTFRLRDARAFAEDKAARLKTAVLNHRGRPVRDFRERPTFEIHYSAFRPVLVAGPCGTGY